MNETESNKSSTVASGKRVAAVRYVTVPMIAAHAGKTHAGVCNALRLTKTPFERIGRNIRIREDHANAFLLRYWPEAGAITQN